MAMIQEKVQKTLTAVAVLRELYAEIRLDDGDEARDLRVAINRVATKLNERAGLQTIKLPKLSALQVLKTAIGRTPRVRPAETNWRGKPITRGQKYMINRLASAYLVNPDAECQRVLACDVDELSSQAASAYIHYLRASAVERAEQTERRTA